MSGNTILVVNTNDGMSQNSRDSFEDAAKRWDCDYIEIKERPYRYHPASLKLKAFDLAPMHDRILVLDADTIIRIDAPNIFEKAKDNTKIYGVYNTQSFYPGINVWAAIGLTAKQVQAIYSSKITNPAYAIDAGSFSNKLMNSGVYVVTRYYHEEVLNFAAYLYLGVPLEWWDQVPLNVAIYNILGGFEDLGVEWNRQFPHNFNYMDAFIYHFAGNPSRYEILKTVNWRNICQLN